MIPHRCSRSFLALLLAAGASGGFFVSAPAGDKIEFSSLDSEDLVRPAVERAESGESPDVLSLLSIDNVLPQQEEPYPVASNAGDAVARRNDELSLNRRSGNDRLSMELDKFGQNGGVENSTWETPATNYSSKLASNYLDTMGAWEKPENLNGLGPGMDKLDPRYAPPGARLESPASLERRALQIGFEAGDAASKSWTSRKDDASSSSDRTSTAEMLKGQNKTLFGADYGLFRPLSQSAWGSASMLPSDPSLSSPLDAAAAGRSPYKPSIGLAPSFSSGKNSGNPDPGNWGGVPAIGGLGDDLGAGYQNAGSSAARKPPVSPLDAGAQRQQGGATLTWPKMPGANY
jgi:hypothetical protein